MEKGKSIEWIKEEDFKIEKPSVCGYNWAIGIAIFLFLAACFFCFWACYDSDFEWKCVVFTSVVIVVLAVLVFYLVRALFTARKENQALYREMEKKRMDVYGKVMDAWLQGEQKMIKDAYDPSVQAQKEKTEANRKEK